MTREKTELTNLVSRAIAKNSELDLTEGEIDLLSLCRLIVDIKYRAHYGDTVGKSYANMYTHGKQFNQVLTDQIPPVDDGLSGLRSTGDICR